MSLIGQMVDAGVRCTVCSKPGYKTCGCWTRCPCGWFYRTGEVCRRAHLEEESPTPARMQMIAVGRLPLPSIKADERKAAAATSLRRLSQLRSTLRRELPGRKNAYARFTITRTAEYAAGGGEAALAVLNSIDHMHRALVGPWLKGELRRALERDLPAPPAKYEVSP